VVGKGNYNYPQKSEPKLEKLMIFLVNNCFYEKNKEKLDKIRSKNNQN